MSSMYMSMPTRAAYQEYVLVDLITCEVILDVEYGVHVGFVGYVVC